VLLVPLILDDEAIGVIGVEVPKFTHDAPPDRLDIDQVESVARMAASCVRDASRIQAVEDDRQRLCRLLEEQRHVRTQGGQLRDQVKEWHALEPLVGESDVFADVLTQVELVAPADSTVLLVGETGTGKERIAREVHQQSRRSGRPFVAVNCAALPEALVESELFGHEKGAFTGAFSRKPGRFELADHGTLFLDEVGDLPEPAQAKLLRVLQEREVQRVGGTGTVPVNVRLISATNHDLSACTRNGRFRRDLFYRLNVFPIRVPALRERRDDVPLLVHHFIRKFAERQHKLVPRLGDGVLERLLEYPWPGNIRELQNVIERAIILARGPFIGAELIMLQLDDGESMAVEAEPREAVSLPRRPGPNVIKFADAERHAILHALELAVWRISGRGGAADILGLKPTTLHAKMKRLGIRRPRHDVTESASAVSGA
jgi:transcriptional regulator with GAF, ATPase, and Fis domain